LIVYGIQSIQNEKKLPNLIERITIKSKWGGYTRRT